MYKALARVIIRNSDTPIFFINLLGVNKFWCANYIGKVHIPNLQYRVSAFPTVYITSRAVNRYLPRSRNISKPASAYKYRVSIIQNKKLFCLRVIPQVEHWGLDSACCLQHLFASAFKVNLQQILKILMVMQNELNFCQYRFTINAPQFSS